MAEELADETYRPHFVIDDEAQPETATVLHALEEHIRAKPGAVLATLNALSNGETPPEPYGNGVVVAVSREAGLEFDDTTEDAIARSAVMVALRLKRKENQKNEARSLELAAEVRRTRLALFIQRRMDLAKKSDATVLPLPDRPDSSVPRQRRRTPKANDRAS